MSASHPSASPDSPVTETPAEPNDSTPPDSVSNLLPTSPPVPASTQQPTYEHESAEKSPRIHSHDVDADAKKSDLVSSSPSPSHSHSDRRDASSARGSRFSRRRFWIIQGLVMSMATAASLSNSIFTPSLPVMQIDLDTSQQAINASVSIATFMNALAPLLWAQLADVRGRRITYILSIPIAIVATILGYFSKNIAMFYVTRIFQQIGMSAVLVAGSGTLSDINPSSSRSQALGFFYLGYQGATTIAPALGGVIADSLGWRWTFIVAAVYTLAIFIAMCILMPETMDPVVLKANRMKGVKNPFAPLVYNKYPFVLALVLQIAFTVMVLYIFSVIIPRDFTRVYAFSTSQIGFVQLFVGFGFFVGTWCFGVYADRMYGTWKAKRGGVSIPEDRLRSTWLPILFIFAGLLVYGWGVERATWFGVPTLGAAVAGAGSQGFGTSCNAFLLDVFPSRGASIIAAANFLRFTLAALGPLAVAPAESTIGVGWFSTLLAGVNLAAWSGIFCIINWGARTRLRMEPWRSEERWDAQREVLFAAGAGARGEKAGEEGRKGLLVA